VHPGGTRNRVVWFADESYLELLAVADPSSTDAAWLADAIADRDRLLAWALRTPDIDAVGRRLGIEVRAGSIERADGAVGSWRTVGGAGAADRPFFIQYDGDRSRRNRVQGTGIAWVEVAGDRAAIDAWVGPCDLDVRVQPGAPGLVGVGIGTDEGELVLRWD
jgi:hypothetical protein